MTNFERYYETIYSKKYLTLEELKKIQDDYVFCRKLCTKCGYGLNLANKEKIICRHCGTLNFKNKEIEFKYRLKQSQYKERKANGKKVQD